MPHGIEFKTDENGGGGGVVVVVNRSTAMWPGNVTEISSYSLFP